MAEKIGEYKVIPAADIIPYARNARTHSDAQVDQIAASIREFGFTNPVLVDEKNNLIAGHGRLMAAKKLKLKELPAIVMPGLTEHQRRALVLADNKIALNSGWDAEMLKIELQDLDTAGYDLSLTGFSDEELDRLLAKVTAGLTDEDDAPDAPTVPVSQVGDVWLLGKHRVMCGDSTNLEAVHALTGAEMVDCLITDPPYNVDYEGKTKDALKIQNDKFAAGGEFLQFLKDAFVAAATVMKPGAVFYIWHADSEGMNFRQAAAESGLRVRQCLIWQKNSMVMGRQDYQWKHEPCLYGWKEGAAHLWNSDRKQTTILEFDRPSRNDVHPTMKPVALIEYQMLNNTKGQDIVLDLFGGSGTTLIAAHKHGRRCFMMEFDPVYVDVIVKRWQEFTGETATLQSTGDSFDMVREKRETKKP